MKKISKSILIILTAVLIFLTACSSAEEPTSTNQSETSYASTTTAQPTEATENQTIFEKFEEKLNNNGFKYEKITQAAEMVGAIQGIGYKTSTGKAEVYKFDSESEAYKTAEKNKALYLEGFGAFEATCKNGTALVLSGFSEKDAEKIEQIFLEIA